jgi:hypothetical protein
LAQLMVDIKRIGDITIGDCKECEQALLFVLPEGKSKKMYWRLSSISFGFSSDDAM